MQLEVVNRVLSRTFLSKMAFNPVHNILAAVFDAADTLSFFVFDKESQQLLEILQGTSKPSGKKTSLAWSPDGVYLALAAAHLEIWKFENARLTPYRTFSEDFVDIKLISWSDNCTIAYGGLSRKNTLKIRKIQSGDLQEISLPLAISSISYDPFGKYLLLLLRNNILYVYSSDTLLVIREIPLSLPINPLENANTVKQTRIIGWSPDFSHIVVSSLDDGKISIALQLSRHNNFAPKKVFFGHVSSISCAVFNPNLFSYENDICSIVALGDSHGIVSIWRVGSKDYHQPLLIINSNSEYHEVVQEIEWDKDGQTLIVNVLKRYVSLVKFDKSKFGRQLSANQKINIIQNSFGVASVTALKNRQVQIFTASKIKERLIQRLSNTMLQQVNLKNQKNQTNTISNQRNSRVIASIPVQSINPPNPSAAPAIPTDHVVQSKALPQIYNFHSTNNELVKLNEQVTIKDKGQKKRIQPAVLVRKDQAQKIKQNSVNAMSSAITTIKSYDPLKLKPLTLDHKIIKLTSTKYLQIRRIQGQSVIKIVTQGYGTERIFSSIIQFVKHSEQKLYVLSGGVLYILDYDLSLLQLPFSLGDTHRLVINDFGDIYHLSTKGLLKGFNYQKNKCYTLCPIPIQTLFEQISFIPQPDSQPISQFQVQKYGKLFISICQKVERYMFDPSTLCWIRLDFTSGHFGKGHSLRVASQEQQLNKLFFQSMSVKLKEKQAVQNPRQLSTIQQIQSNLIYFKKYEPNKQLYLVNLLNLIKELKYKNLHEKLRSAIYKYFVNKDSSQYEDDPRLLKQIRNLGGNIIDQFMLFGQL